ncbi:MAG: phytoene desaturase family protein [Saprospiraceae bacterium]
MPTSIGIIGAGYAGMTAAALLAKQGYSVKVFEKNDTPGGRAGIIEEQGFRFDKGPSFYWMPDIFERFFNHFGKSAGDYYQLIRLDPSYKIFWKDREPINMPANLKEAESLFESLEAGAGIKLRHFLEEAKKKYEIGIGEFVYLPSLSFGEYMDWRLIKNMFSLDLFQSMTRHIAKHFKNKYIQQILEFPVLFLGAKPSSTPALYSLMNYADLVLGTWYPQGGMYEVSKAFYKVGVELGVQYEFNREVQSIHSNGPDQVSLTINSGDTYTFDYVIAGADYHHVESELLNKSSRSYSSRYWETRSLAPSTLLYFLGFDMIVPNLEHHSLFFDASFDQHTKDIYDQPSWPKDPLFYTNSSSLTDTACAPAGHHNLVALIPVSTELIDSDEIKAQYLEIILNRLSFHSGMDLRRHLVYQRSYAQRDFIQDYHSFKGNAYGLANTLMQTGPWRPSTQSKKIKNLYFTGQLTVPGPGLPPAVISGEIVSTFIHKQITKQH